MSDRNAIASRLPKVRGISRKEMSNRHLSRTIVMQTLFEWDFHGRPPLKELATMLDHNRNEFAIDFDDGNFAEELLRHIIDRMPELDAMIVKYAPEWPLEQITTVDRNTLRLGIYELLFASEIPARVAINESVELAKTFGGDSSSRFVNGVLGAIYRDAVAAGKVKEIDKASKESTVSSSEQ